MILIDLQCLREIFNDTKRRTVSLRQPSFLYLLLVLPADIADHLRLQYRLIDYEN